MRAREDYQTLEGIDKAALYIEIAFKNFNVNPFFETF
jgi:hypothetical protein